MVLLFCKELGKDSNGGKKAEADSCEEADARGKKEWERLADLMIQMGVLTEVDMAAFAAYCQSYARWKKAQEHITSGGSTFEMDKGYQQQTPWVGNIKVTKAKSKEKVDGIVAAIMALDRAVRWVLHEYGWCPYDEGFHC